MERQEERTICGLVRNPLGYLYRATNPDTDLDLHAPAEPSEASARLSADLASALGLGLGCDSEDDPSLIANWMRNRID